MATPGDTAWTPEEFQSATEAYVAMLVEGIAGRTYVKRRVNERLRAGPLVTRSATSVERRMQNISAILVSIGAPWIGGYKPLDNVGDRGRTLILEALETAPAPNPARDFVPSSHPQAAHDRAIALMCGHALRQPPGGNETPFRRMGSTMVFERLPGVIAWILNQADGLCELCRSPAPFKRLDGTPYLEVHHVIGLASGGPDTVENAVAICPNCHRRCHYSDDADTAIDALYDSIDRLVPP